MMSLRLLNNLLGSSAAAAVATASNQRFYWALSGVFSKKTSFKDNSTFCLHSNTRTLSSLMSSTKTSPTAFDRQQLLAIGNESFGPFFYLQQRGAKKRAGGKGGKGKKAAAAENEEEEEEEEEEEDSDLEGEDEGESKDVKVLHSTVISLRLDAVGKTVFNTPRAKVEESFYKDLIRVNGERVAKKSVEIRVDDVLDLIKGVNVEDRSKLDITRVEILSVDDKAASSGRIRVSFRKTNGLVVDNYSRDPYEGLV